MREHILDMVLEYAGCKKLGGNNSDPILVKVETAADKIVRLLASEKLTFGESEMALATAAKYLRTGPVVLPGEKYSG